MTPKRPVASSSVASRLPHRVTPDGSAGPFERVASGRAGRYHLYVVARFAPGPSHLIFRKLKDLARTWSRFPWSRADPDETAGAFDKATGSTGDALFGKDTLWQVYTQAVPGLYRARTVPVLWDKQTGTIVSTKRKFWKSSACSTRPSTS